jgi:hypothetical protein
MSIPDLFLDHPRIRRIYSIWFDDFHSFLRAPSNQMFPSKKRSMPEILRNDRLIHCFYGEAMTHEARLFGIQNRLRSNLAASSDFLRQEHPCEVRDKLAFIGNPGSRLKPTTPALQAMDAGADLDRLREISRAEVLHLCKAGAYPWAKDIEGFIDLMAAATFAKSRAPNISALQILELCRDAAPAAFDQLNARGSIYDAAMLVKLVCRYDRPALVRRLQRAGLCEVYSNEHEWAVYDVPAKPSFRLDELPQAYMRHFAHVNAANPLRDAPANEKLFEIAACARTSINLWSPDVADCYSQGEIQIVDTLADAEACARRLIADPDAALEAGRLARLRTAREHTWEHRLAALWLKDSIWQAPPAASQSMQAMDLAAGV